jgi:uncharacterized membrane protein (UPF0127 family)
MSGDVPARRLRRLPRAVVHGREVRIAVSPPARLLGLAGLRPDQAGGGLLIPRCLSVHTFGLRFRLDVLFLGRSGAVIEERRDVPPGRVLCCRRAAAVLEAPAGRLGPNSPRRFFHAAFI